MAGSVEADKAAEADVPLPKETEELKEEEEQVAAKNAQAVEEKIDLKDKPAIEQVQAQTVQSTEESEEEDSPAAEQITAKIVQPVKEKIEVDFSRKL